MKKDDIMVVSNESVKKIQYKGKTFYVIGRGIYLQTKYGMSYLAGRHQRVGNKVYNSPEAYIIEDPNRGIAALENMC